MTTSEKPIIWNYGGGKQSVAIAVLIVQGKLPRPERIVIADTGRESSATWEYLEKYTNPMLTRVGLKIQVIPHSLAYHDLRDRKGRLLPPSFTAFGKGMTRTFCSGEWKRDVVYRYLRQHGYGPRNPVIQWIGYSLDEIGRCKPGKRAWAEQSWPLIMGYGQTYTRSECVQIIKNQGLPEPLKSACWMCAYRTNKEWAEQRDLYPKDHRRAISLEKSCSSVDKMGGVFFHRSGVPLDSADLSVPDPPEHPLFGRGETCESGSCWT